MLHEVNYDYVPGTSGIDERFVPPEYRGLTMDQLKKQLYENSKTKYEKDFKKIPSWMKCREAIVKVKKDMGLDISLRPKFDETSPDEVKLTYENELTELKKNMDISDLSKDRIRIMNRNIRHYRNQVSNALIDLQRKLDWCNDNEQRSRQILQELERAYPGSDYGSSEENGDTVCRNVRFFFEDKIVGIEKELLFIKGIESEKVFYDDALAISNREYEINRLLDLTRGISGLNVFHIDMNYSTEPNGILFLNNDEESDDEQNAKKTHPELARKLEILENNYRSIKDRESWYYTQIRINSDFSRILSHLKTMRPVSEFDAEISLAKIQHHNLYNSWQVKGWKVVSVSDSGETMVKETPNPSNYAVYDKNGELNDFVRNYNKIIYDRNGNMKNPTHFKKNYLSK